MYAAVLPAAGAGERFKKSSSGIAKQFIQLGDRSLYMWSLTALLEHEKISRVAVVVPESSLNVVLAEIEQNCSPALISKTLVTAGGATRQESVWKGLEALAKEEPTPDYVMVHDAARPMLNKDMLDEVIEALTIYGACTLALSVTDTIKMVTDGYLGETLDRSRLVQIQTPQAARFEWLLHAHRRARIENFGTTDDSTILEFDGHKVHIVPGSPNNLKITNPEDLIVCHSLMNFHQKNG